MDKHCILLVTISDMRAALSLFISAWRLRDLLVHDVRWKQFCNPHLQNVAYLTFILTVMTHNRQRIIGGDYHCFL